MTRTRRRTAPFARFGASYVVDASTGCWLWTAYLNASGYGALSVGGRKIYAHRYAYSVYVGPILDGHQIDHLCRTPACVNPAHLQAVPQHVNNARSESISARNARKTHCIHGHEFTEANTYRRNDTGARQCKACHTTT